jgi:hypothetical protein
MCILLWCNTYTPVVYIHTRLMHCVACIYMCVCLYTHPQPTVRVRPDTLCATPCLQAWRLECRHGPRANGGSRRPYSHYSMYVYCMHKYAHLVTDMFTNETHTLVIFTHVSCCASIGLAHGVPPCSESQWRTAAATAAPPHTTRAPRCMAWGRASAATSACCTAL